MQLRIINIILFLCFVGIILSYEEELSSQVDAQQCIEIPIVSGAYNIQKITDRPKGTKSVNYYLQVEYPAIEVIEFYEKKFKGRGWLAPFDEVKRQWESFIDGTISGNPRVRQFLASWVNPERKEEAFLALRYIRVGKNWDRELHVLCQIQPMLDVKTLESFLKMLWECGEYVEFMKLLDSYRTENGEVNIDKAIRENRDNIYLREYKRIVDEVIPEPKGHPKK